MTATWIELAGAHNARDLGGLRAGSRRTRPGVLLRSDALDALTADDRPYKRALPLEKALGILESEVKVAKLDGDLFKLFVDARIYELRRSKTSKAA